MFKGDLQGTLAGGEPAIPKIIMATHAGMTTADVNSIERMWSSTAKHTTTHRFLTNMVYQPMLELLSLPRAHGFKTSIVPGGGVEFIRP